MTKQAQRIVSLLPAATEWICKLGFADRLVAISHECDFPNDVGHLPRITRARIDPQLPSEAIDQQVRELAESQVPLYDLDSDLLRDLRPDLLVTQSLCHVCAVDRGLAQREVSSWDCQILDLCGMNFDQVLEDGLAVANAAGPTAASRAAMEELQARVDQVVRGSTPYKHRRPRVTLLEWTDPLFCSGHWTPQLIQWAGGVDPIGKTGQPSREISVESIHEADPDLLLVACCGLDRDRTQREWETLRNRGRLDSLKAVQNNAVYCFDGSAWFNRAGPRLIDALEHIAGLITHWAQSQTAA